MPETIKELFGYLEWLMNEWYPPKHPQIGGDTDEHGCCIGAGYVWCQTKERCVRIWEEPCASCKIRRVCKNISK